MSSALKSGKGIPSFSDEALLPRDWAISDDTGVTRKGVNKVVDLANPSNFRDRTQEVEDRRKSSASTSLSALAEVRPGREVHQNFNTQQQGAVDLANPRVFRKQVRDRARSSEPGPGIYDTYQSIAYAGFRGQDDSDESITVDDEVVRSIQESDRYKYSVLLDKIGRIRKESPATGTDPELRRLESYYMDGLHLSDELRLREETLGADSTQGVLRFLETKGLTDVSNTLITLKDATVAVSKGSYIDNTIHKLVSWYAHRFNGGRGDRLLDRKSIRSGDLYRIKSYRNSNDHKSFMTFSVYFDLVDSHVNGMKSPLSRMRQVNPNSPQFYCGGRLVQPVESVGYSPTNPNFSSLVKKGKEAWAMIPIMYMIEELIGAELRIINRSETISRITAKIDQITDKAIAAYSHSSHISEHDEVGDQYSPVLYLKEQGYQTILMQYAEFMNLCTLKPKTRIEHLGFEMRDIQILEQLYSSMAAQVLTVALCHFKGVKFDDMHENTLMGEIFRGYSCNPFQKRYSSGLSTTELDIVTLSERTKVKVMSRDGTKIIAYDEATMSPDPNDTIHNLLMEEYGPYDGPACHIIDMNMIGRAPKGKLETIDSSLEDTKEYTSFVRGLEPRFPPPLPGE